MRRLALAAAAVAFLGSGAAHGASITVEMDPQVTSSAVVFTYSGAAAGTLVPNYVVSFTVTGAITTNGVTTAVTDRWEGLMLAPYGLSGQRGYPASPSSTIALAYTARVVAVSGVPTFTCAGVLTRQGGGTPTVTGGC